MRLIFVKKWAIFGQILEKMDIFCLLNDLKLPNAKINNVRSCFNTELTLIYLDDLRWSYPNCNKIQARKTDAVWVRWCSLGKTTLPKSYNGKIWWKRQYKFVSFSILLCVLNDLDVNFALLSAVANHIEVFPWILFAHSLPPKVRSKVRQSVPQGRLRDSSIDKLFICRFLQTENLLNLLYCF